MRKGSTGPLLAAALLLAGCVPDVVKDMRAPPPRPPAAQRADAPASPDAAADRPRYPPDEPPPSQSRAAAADGVHPYPGDRPAWETRPVAAESTTVAASTLIARPGDTLARVAARTGAGTGAIAQANGLTPPYAIEAGQRLTIPGGRYHTVRPGQSGIAIARAYGVTWSRIVAANGLAEPFTLRVGERLLIPGAAAGTGRLAERAAAFTLDIDDILTGGEPAAAPGQAPVRPSARPGRVLPPTAVVAAPSRLSGGFAWPVDGRVVKHFGPGASGERNDGIKIAVPSGTPVRATAAGVVAYVGDGIAALGGLVIVKHGDRWTSVYGHLSRLLVQRGQSVRQGQTIALSGATGFADRPEVHFELRKGRVPVDPLTQLPGR